MEPYKNKSLTIHERVVDLLGRLTLKEKVGQVNQHLYGWKVYERDADGKIVLTDYFKDHVAWGGGLGALYGLFRADPWSEVTYDNGITPEESREVVELVQDYLMEHSRMKIPALIVEECPHGHQGLNSVSYPTNIGRGSMFNPDMMRKMSEMMAEELAYKGVHIALVSTLDLARDPRWGRTEECFGEDPYLAEIYTKAVIEGFQKGLISDSSEYRQQTVAEIDRQPNQVGVVLKHLIAQGDALGGHNSGEVTIGQREFFDIYDSLIASTKEAVGVMAAYNDIDGIPCHANRHLIEETLRGKHHFQGLVMADGGAIDRLQSLDYKDMEKARLALEAGIDLSLWDSAYLSIEAGVNTDVIDEDALNEAVYNVLSVKFLLGLFDQDQIEMSDHSSYDETLKKWQKVNLESARESMTLIKNNEKLLPLTDIKKIAVVGPNADHLYHQLGDYTSPQTFKESTTLKEGIEKVFTSSTIAYAEGCKVRSNSEDINKAVHISKDADVIVLALGGSSARNFGGDFLSNGALNTPEENMDSGENIDLAELTLGGHQLALLRELSTLNIPIVTVLIQGRPHVMDEILELSQAVLIGWYPGQQGGLAIAEVLAGHYNPNGRMAVSVPRSSGQLPVYYNQKHTLKKEDYFDMSGTPSVSFGDGLSYSDIRYHSMEISKDGWTMDELKTSGIRVSIKVTNDGPLDAKESVLCFIRQSGTPVLSRKKELKRLKKIALAVGETEEVTFTLNYNDFVLLDADYNKKVYPSSIKGCIGSEQVEFKLREGV